MFEDGYVCFILDHDPFNEGHVLILPKRHIRYFDELDVLTANSLINASSILSKALKELFHPDGITVCQNSGTFDDLTHFHMHVVPRYEGQSFADFYINDREFQIEDEAKLKETKQKFYRNFKGIELKSNTFSVT